MVELPVEYGGIAWGSRYPSAWHRDARILFNIVDIDLSNLDETQLEILAGDAALLTAPLAKKLNESQLNASAKKASRAENLVLNLADAVRAVEPSILFEAGYSLSELERQTNKIFDALSDIIGAHQRIQPYSGQAKTVEWIAKSRLLIQIYWRWCDDGREPEMLGRQYSERRHEGRFRSITKDPITGKPASGLYEVAYMASQHTQYWKFPIYDYLPIARDELEAELGASKP